jgi:hypothetical protein
MQLAILVTTCTVRGGFVHVGFFVFPDAIN